MRCCALATFEAAKQAIVISVSDTDHCLTSTHNTQQSPTLKRVGHLLHMYRYTVYGNRYIESKYSAALEKRTPPNTDAVHHTIIHKLSLVKTTFTHK